MRAIPLAVVAPAVLMVGCEPQTAFTGMVMSGLFPYDGDRTWEYISTDQELPYKLIATTVGSERHDGRNVYTVQYAKECLASDPTCVTGEVLRTVRWSSTSGDGVHIWGYTLGGSNPVEFDPPVQVALDTMKRDDVAETRVDGADWTSTMLGTDICPIAFTANWDECGVLRIETTATDGYPITGTYYAARRNNLAAIELEGDTGRWELSDFDCEGDCNGVW